MNEENTNIYILNEITKGAQMGMDSISFVSEKTDDESFKDDLSYQYKEYGQILDSVNTEYTKYGKVPDQNNVKDKMMGWTGVQMNTMNDRTTSHIADMLIQGTTMGIIKGRKLLNHNPEADSSVKDILNRFVKMQENNVEKLKSFL